MKNGNGKLTELEFTKTAILKLRQKGYKGIHSVYSGFNAAFRTYFPGHDPVKAVTIMVKKNDIAIRYVRGGVMLYLPTDITDTTKNTLTKMGVR